MKKIISLIVIVLFFVQCTTEPITGRKQFNIVKDENVLPASFAQYRGFLEKKHFI